MFKDFGFYQKHKKCQSSRRENGDPSQAAEDAGIASKLLPAYSYFHTPNSDSTCMEKGSLSWWALLLFWVFLLSSAH